MFFGEFAVHVHLAHIGMVKAAEFQVDDDQAAQTTVKEEQVNPIPRLVDSQATLSAYKREVAA